MLMDRIAVDAVRGRLGEIVIIEAPPRHGKSEYVSTYLPSWFLGRNPDKRVILATYGAEYSVLYGRRCRDLLSRFGTWYGLPGIREDVSGATNWQLAGAAGGMTSVGIGGPITGRGADLLIIDDPIKNAEEAISETVRDAQWDWFTSTAWTRLEPGGVCFLMMTRWHEDDLIGRVVKLADECRGTDKEFRYSRLTLPAFAEPSEAAPDPLGRRAGEPLWPERYGSNALEQKRTMLGDYWFNSLYQQRPGQYGRAEWPDAYFAEPFWVKELPEACEWSVIAIDPSKGKDTGDFSGIAWVGFAHGLLWVDCDVERLTTAPLCRAIVRKFVKRGAERVGLEGNAWQELLAGPIEQATREAGIPPMPVSLINNSVAKPLRIGRLGPYLDRHAFRFLDTSGNRELVRQLKSFPQGDHDDGPDALEMAVRLLDHVVRQALAEAS